MLLETFSILFSLLLVHVSEFTEPLSTVNRVLKTDAFVRTVVSPHKGVMLCSLIHMCAVAGP